jgi:hypothetical protein
MPKYLNVGPSPIHLAYDNVIIEPGEEVEVLHFYKDENLKLISVKPYLNPFKYVNVDTTDSSTPKEYDVYGYSFMVIPFTSTVIIHLNENPSDSHFVLPKGFKCEFKNSENLVNKLYVTTESTSPVQFYIAIYNPEYMRF